MSKQQKTNKELIASIKKMNKTAREGFAKRNGFSSSIDYIEHLKGNPTKSTSDIKVKKALPVVHVVDILDVSGSMSGSKISSALSGVNEGIKALIKETKVDYTYSLVAFSSWNDIRKIVTFQKPSTVGKISLKTRDLTALYDAIGSTLKAVKAAKNDKDKVLINIYTDGGENDSKVYDKQETSKLIEKYAKLGFTVTFIGTVQDTETAIKDLKIKKSNTLSYDGTADGLSKTMTATNNMRAVYASAVSNGEDVSIGFYKNFN